MTPDEDSLNPIRLTPEQKEEVLGRVGSGAFTLESCMKSGENFAILMRGAYGIKGPGDMAIHQGMALYYPQEQNNG